MPVPVKLGLDFTQMEIDAMKDGVQVVIDTITSKIVLNLSEQERKNLSKVGPERLPYVYKSVEELAPMYPKFNPITYDVNDVEKDFRTYGRIDEVLVKLKEADELSTELQMVAGHFSYLFMRKQFELAESNKNENVPGAQVIYDALKDCFEGQGNFGEEETAGGDTPTP